MYYDNNNLRVLKYQAETEGLRASGSQGWEAP